MSDKPGMHSAGGSVPVVYPKPRRPNAWQRGGRSLVSIVECQRDVTDSVRHSLDLIGGLARLIEPGEAVMLKPNLVAPQPPPVSTDLPFLRAVIELLREAGAGPISIGESTGRSVGKTTREVYQALGYDTFAADLGVRLICFDETDWVRVKVRGQYWDSFRIPRPLYDAAKLVYLPTLKTHFLAGFTGSLKLAVGNSYIPEREYLHAGPVGKKAVEFNLALQPDLCIMDARRVFVDGGPIEGLVAEPGLILASGDQIAMDVEGARILQRYGQSSLLAGDDPWSLPMIRHAVKLGLGVRQQEACWVVGDRDGRPRAGDCPPEREPTSD